MSASGCEIRLAAAAMRREQPATHPVGIQPHDRRSVVVGASAGCQALADDESIDVDLSITARFTKLAPLDILGC